MSIIQCKGTVFSMGVGDSVPAIAQVISLDLPKTKIESFEADTLDNENAGIPKKSTGRVDGGSVSGELFLDLAIHTSLTAIFSSPPAPGASADEQYTGTITFPGGSKMSFDVCSVELGGTVALNDGLKGDFSCELDGCTTFS